MNIPTSPARYIGESILILISWAGIPKKKNQIQSQNEFCALISCCTLDSGIDVAPGINVAPSHHNFNTFLHQSRHCGHF